jgi:indoleamine 2,3-dioxygenase
MSGGPPRLPTPEALRCQTLFTSTRDEAEFYLATARIELRGVRALALMRSSMDEAFVGDATALRRLTAYLSALAGVIDTLTSTLLAVREGCDPDVFYHEIRPWFKGEDSAREGRRWVFDGAEERGLAHPTELSGPSAGQSALVHALDIFLGVDQYSHAPALTGKSTAVPQHDSEPSPAVASDTSNPSTGKTATGTAFLDRMQLYMPRHHRAFLRHLAASPYPLRALVETSTEGGKEPALREAYNAAVRALKGFRDAHMRIVALYIIQPARRAQAAAVAAASGAARAQDEKGRWLQEEQGAPLKGTGGTELVRFLKGVRDRTASAVLEPRAATASTQQS